MNLTPDHSNIGQAYLLANQPLLTDGDFSANSYIELLDSTLSLHELDQGKCVCIVADNTEVNLSISRKWKIPKIGCASHWFNLACKMIVWSK